MILEKLFNEIADCYGKKIKKYEISFNDEGHIFFKLKFSQDENLMLKIWMKKDFNNYDNTYELVLFKDNVYSNEYLMKDLNNLYTFLEKFNSDKLDYRLGNYSIEISNKMKEYINKAINLEMKNKIKYITNNYISDNNYWINSLTDILDARRYFERYFKFIENKNKI